MWIDLPSFGWGCVVALGVVVGGSLYWWYFTETAQERAERIRREWQQKDERKKWMDWRRQLPNG